MRFAKTLYILFILCVSLGLSCSELPESFNFNDDTTNDFVEDSASPLICPTREISNDPLRARSVIIAAEPTPRFLLTPAAARDIRSGQDLLRFFAVQRK